MAKHKHNIIMRDVRGMIGRQIVFKSRAGNGYVAAAPRVNKNRQPTPAQQAMRDKFRLSVAYAKAAMKDPAVKMSYELAAARNQSAFNMALRDAQNAPKVESLITTGYTGAMGSLIVARVTDDFKVNAVTVSIRNCNDELIEEGSATLEFGDRWLYTSRVSNPNVCGAKVKATAYDIPANENSLEVTL